MWGRKESEGTEMIGNQGGGSERDLQGGIIGKRGWACARGLSRREGMEEGLGAMQEGGEMGGTKTGGEEVRDR